jgi:hypothetical protein
VADAPAGHAPFALWNRSGNRLVAVLLRLPLHPLVSRRLAVTGPALALSTRSPLATSKAASN